MTEELINQLKVVAEFDGWKEIKDDEPEINGIWEKGVYPNQDFEYISDFKYHTSFDWLVPVYNKSLRLLYNSNELQLKIATTTEGMMALRAIQTAFDYSVDKQIHIEPAFLKVYDFITWYNTIKK
jgi:hypothetical protein